MPDRSPPRGPLRRYALASSALSTLLCLMACEGGVGGPGDAGPPAPGADAGGARERLDAAALDPWLDAATDFDSGRRAQDAPDAGGAAEGAGVFVGQGHAGRTLVSCDDGRTWHADHARDPSVDRCFDGADCDHGAFTAKGIAYGRRGFVTAWGWGSDDGTIERSEDGATWTRVATQGSRPNYGGVVFGADAFVAARQTGSTASRDGAVWEAAGELTGYTRVSVRRVGVGGGRIFVYGDGGGRRGLVVSDDDGATWEPSALPDSDCTAGIQNQGGFVEVADAVIVAGNAGVACASTDRGASWTVVRVASGFSSTLAARGGEAWIYSPGRAHHSADGVTWTSEDTTPNDLDLGAIGVSDLGTVVGAPGRRFQTARWYDGQLMWRSEDGLTFEQLPSSAYEGGHPIRFFAYGAVDTPPCD